MKRERQHRNHNAHNMEHDKHSERNIFDSRSFIFRWDYYKSGSR